MNRSLLSFSLCLASVGCATSHQARSLSLERIVSETRPTSAEIEPAPSTTDDPASLPAERFFSKRLTVGRVPVMSHADASDDAVKTVRDVLGKLLTNAPRLRRNLEANGMQVHVSAYGHRVSDLPQLRSFRGTRTREDEDFDDHMGQGGTVQGRVAVCIEALVVPKNEGQCGHELAHAIEFNGLAPALREHIFRMHAKAVAAGRWKGEYAATTYGEYFAEATRLWLSEPQRLQREDPDAFAFVRAVYDDQIDPGEAPREAELRLLSADQESRLRSGDGNLPVRIRLTNHRKDLVRLVWIDGDGRRETLPLDRLKSAKPDQTIDITTFSTHAFVLANAEGRAVASFEAPGTDAFVHVR